MVKDKREKIGKKEWGKEELYGLAKYYLIASTEQPIFFKGLLVKHKVQGREMWFLTIDNLFFKVH